MGEKIRNFFRELFGSRYVEHLETEILRVQQDCIARLQDKELVIAELRSDKAQLQAKIISYEQVIMPLSSRAGASIASSKPLKPSWATDLNVPPPMTRWQLEQKKHDEENARLDAEEKEKAAAAASKG